MARSSFTAEERRRFRLSKYLREHLFDYGLRIVGNVICILLVLRLCGGTNYLLGAALATAWSLGKTVWDIRWYQRDYLEQNSGSH